MTQTVEDETFISEEDRHNLIQEVFARNADAVRDIQAEYEEAQLYYEERERELQEDIRQPSHLSTPISVVRKDRRKQDNKKGKDNSSNTSTTTAATSKSVEEEEAAGDKGTNEQDANSPPSETSASTSAAIASTSASPAPSVNKKKKKKKKKSKTANLPEAGTEIADDYQEKYVDDVVEDPYDPARPLPRRVEHALWKYRRNHKFTQENRAIFDDYLTFGGVNTSPNAFLGRATSADTPADPEAEVDYEAAKAGTDAIDWDDTDDEEDNGYVSFSEVVQVYLGNAFINCGPFYAVQDYTNAPVLVDAFLRYLQLRQVCPEYADDLVKAREYANQAKVELPKTKRIRNLLPGDVNTAFGIVFVGEVRDAALIGNDDNDDENKGKSNHQPLTVELPSWCIGNSKHSDLASQFLEDVIGMSTARAHQLVNSVLPKTARDNIKDEKVVDNRYRILVKVKHIPTAVDGDNEGKQQEDQRIKVTLVEYNEDLDLTVEEASYDLYFEKNIVDEMFMGMVLNVTLYQVSCGQWYLDRVFGVYPSFYKKDEFAELNEKE